MSLRHRRQSEANYWPGFVDAMATLLLVIVFLLSIFILAQVYLSQQISGRDSILNQLRLQISELTNSLDIEKADNIDLEDQLSILQTELNDANSRRTTLEDALANLRAEAGDGQQKAQISFLEEQIAQEQQLSEKAQSQILILNQQILALRQQLNSISAALEVSENENKENQNKIQDLGKRLNIALASKVQQLNEYRSDFFGRMRQILNDREDIRIVGDRFVFQSELLFSPGAASISSQGRLEIGKLAAAITEISEQIPPEINWIIRVDGHTDNRPISTERFPSNWELSAARAIEVARVLTEFGVPSNRLLAAGFGEFQPLDEGVSEEALARNRRIEFKLTER